MDVVQEILNKKETPKNESRFIGSLLADEGAIFEVYDKYEYFTEKVFEDKVMLSVFKAIYDLAENGTQVNVVTVSHKSGIKEADLARCLKDHNSSGCKKPTIYAGILYDVFIKRTASVVLQEAISGIYEGKGLYKKLSSVISELSGILDTGSTKYEKTAAEATDELMQELIRVRKLKLEGKDTTMTGVPTGLAVTDNLFLGWQPNKLIVTAARPGMGKTSLVVKTIHVASSRGYPVGVFTLEMASSELMEKILGFKSRVSSRKMRSADYTEEEMEAIDMAAKEARKLPIYYNEKGGANAEEIVRYANKWKRLHDIQLLVIDYLQIVKSLTKNKNRDTILGEITGALKALAKNLKIPVIALAQVGREAERRGGSKRPNLSDLRESGNIEQDADIVMFIYRPEYYGIEQDAEGNSLKGVAELIVAKHRGGGLDKLKCGFNGELTEFYDLPTDYFPKENPFDPEWTPEKSTQFPVPENVSVPRPEKGDDLEEIPF